MGAPWPYFTKNVLYTHILLNGKSLKKSRNLLSNIEFRYICPPKTQISGSSAAR